MELSTTPHADKERRKSLNRVFGKIKTALRRGSVPQTAVPGPSGTPVDLSTSNKENEAPAAPLSEDVEVTEAPPPPVESAAMEVAKEIEVMEPDTDPARDRVAALFAKYIVEPQQPAWPVQPKPQHERVQKSIRMRIRYTCHRCQTSFGHEKECGSCQHRRCTKCNRYPPRKTREQKAERTAAAAAVAASAGTPAPALGRNDAIEDKACTCHECQTEIVIGIEECPNCHHTICDRCYQEAAIFDDSPQQMANTAASSSKPVDPAAEAPSENAGTSEVAS